MNEEKLKQILDKIGKAEVPPDVARITEQTSRRFDSALGLLQPKRQTGFFTGFRLIAAAAVVVLAFAAGRWSKPTALPDVTTYTARTTASATVNKNPESFWQQKVVAAMQPRPYAQNQFSETNLHNAYKQYLKERHND
jgi:hypothetical protein